MALGHWQNRSDYRAPMPESLRAASGLEKLISSKALRRMAKCRQSQGRGPHGGEVSKQEASEMGKGATERAAGFWRGIRILKTRDSP